MAALTSAAGVRKPPGEQMDAQRGAYQLRPKLQRLVTASQSSAGSAWLGKQPPIISEHIRLVGERDLRSVAAGDAVAEPGAGSHKRRARRLRPDTSFDKGNEQNTTSNTASIAAATSYFDTRSRRLARRHAATRLRALSLGAIDDPYASWCNFALALTIADLQLSLLIKKS